MYLNVDLPKKKSKKRPFKDDKIFNKTISSSGIVNEDVIGKLKIF